LLRIFSSNFFKNVRGSSDYGSHVRDSAAVKMEREKDARIRNQNNDIEKGRGGTQAGTIIFHLETQIDMLN
jgi:hypothetical protein